MLQRESPPRLLGGISSEVKKKSDFPNYSRENPENQAKLSLLSESNLSCFVYLFIFWDFVVLLTSCTYSLWVSFPFLHESKMLKSFIRFKRCASVSFFSHTYTHFFFFSVYSSHFSHRLHLFQNSQCHFVVRWSLWSVCWCVFICQPVCVSVGVLLFCVCEVYICSYAWVFLV